METLHTEIFKTKNSHYESEEQNSQETDERDFKYSEKFINSFTQAVEKIEKDEILQEDSFNICLLDIDGVLFNNLVKLPITSHLVKPQIKDKTRQTYNKLVKLFDSNIAISTNRSENEKYIFNSQEVLKEVRQLVNFNETKIPIFTNLFKQKPSLTKEDVSKHDKWTNEKVIKPRIDALIQYVGKLATEKDYKTYNLTSIEDWSIVSLNRKDFLRYLTKQLKENYDIEIEKVRNYVIKR
jgi:hypothetical protein